MPRASVNWIRRSNRLFYAIIVNAAGVDDALMVEPGTHISRNPITLSPIIGLIKETNSSGINMRVTAYLPALRSENLSVQYFIRSFPNACVQ